MPRSVRIAIIVSGALSLLGVLSGIVWTADLLGNDAATRWLREALGVPNGALRLVLNPLYLQAVLVVPAALKRHARARELAFQLALFASLLLGFGVLAVLGVAAAARRMEPSSAGVLVVFGLTATLAWSLSRPSAKEWFAPPAA